MKKQCARLVPVLLCLTLLGCLLISSFTASALTLNTLVNFEGKEHGADLVKAGVVSWAKEGLYVTADTSVHADGVAGAKINTAAVSTWQNMVLPVPAQSLKYSSALIFYIKTPAKIEPNQNMNFTFTFEYEDSGYTYPGNAKIQTLAKGAAAWQETDYWKDYGPNIPFGFEGFVKLPLSGLGVKWTNVEETTVSLEKVRQLTIYWSNFGGDSGPFYVDAFCAIKGADDNSTDIDDILNPKPATTTTTAAATTASPASTTAAPEKAMDVLCDFESYQNGDNLRRDAEHPQGLLNFPNSSVAMDLHAEASDKAAADGRLSMQVSADIKQDWAQGLFYLPGQADYSPYTAIILYVKAPVTGKNEEFNFSIAACIDGGDYRLPDCDVQFLRRGSTKWTKEKYFDNFGAPMGTGFEGYIKFSLKDFVPTTAGIPEKLNPASLHFFSFWFHNFGGFSDAEGTDTAFYIDAVYGVRTDSDDTGFVPDDWASGGTTQPTASTTTAWQGDTDPEPVTPSSTAAPLPTQTPNVDTGVPGQTGLAALLAAAAAAGLLLLRLKPHTK